MNSNILNVLDTYQLNDQTNLAQRLERFTRRDWLMLSNALDDLYKTLPSPDKSQSRLTPLTFSFAALPPNLLPNISTHLLVADSVLLDDPLYDIAGMLAEYDTTNIPRNVIPYRATKKILIKKAIDNINFYWQAKELIQEKRLVIHKQIELPSIAKQFDTEFLNAVKKDRHLQKIWYGNTNAVQQTLAFWARLITARVLRKKGDSVIDFIASSRTLQNAWEHAVIAYPVVSSLNLLAICGGFQGLSTDFISPDYAYVYRRSLEIATHINKELPNDEQIFVPANFSLNGLNLPILKNVPVERVLDCIEQEPSVFELFRANVNEHLLGISSPPGTAEREKEIAALNQSIYRDVAEIRVAYETLEKSFSKKFALHVFLGLSSIAVAGFSTIGQNLDALAIASGVFAGAGLSTSIKEFAKDWGDYQQEISQFKSKENYFVWKILSPKAP